MPQVTLSLFDLTDDPTIRTPKRGECGYAAQVWVTGGYWELGVFKTRREARTAAKLFDVASSHLTATARFSKLRSDGHRPRYKWVRQVKGQAWQARPWLGAKYGSLNLGLFTISQCGESAEWAAAQVSKAFDREWQGGRTVGQVVELLKQSRKPVERVAAHVEVPEHQRDVVREKAVPVDRERERAERVARERRDNLFGEPVTVDIVLERWESDRERREAYLADFMQGLEEGETVEDLVELLAEG